MNTPKIVANFPLDSEDAQAALGEDPSLATQRTLLEALVTLQKSGAFKKYVAMLLQPKLEDEIRLSRESLNPDNPNPAKAAWHEGRAQLLEGILDYKAFTEILGAEIASKEKPNEVKK